MKMDMEIIRKILLKIEEKCPPNEYEIFTTDNFPGLDWEIILGHSRLMENKGLFQGVSQEITDNWFSVDGLSWEGYEFLENIRDPEIWQKTKTTAIDLKNFGFDTIKSLAKGYLKQKIKQQTGLDVE